MPDQEGKLQKANLKVANISNLPCLRWKSRGHNTQTRIAPCN